MNRSLRGLPANRKWQGKLLLDSGNLTSGRILEWQSKFPDVMIELISTVPADALAMAFGETPYTINYHYAVLINTEQIAELFDLLPILAPVVNDKVELSLELTEITPTNIQEQDLLQVEASMGKLDEQVTIKYKAGSWAVKYEDRFLAEHFTWSTMEKLYIQNDKGERVPIEELDEAIRKTIDIEKPKKRRKKKDECNSPNQSGTTSEDAS